MADYTGYVGYLKLEGSDIEDGVLGAKQTANLLIGFNNTVRYFLMQQDSRLAYVDFEIPVRVKKGSLQALIPNTIEKWIIDAIGAGILAYTTTAATQIAKNDFQEKDFKALVRASLRQLQGVIKIAKHVGGMGNRAASDGVRFVNNNQDVDIPNDDGVYIRTSREELESYLKTPKRMLNEIARFLEDDRVVILAEVDANGTPNEEKITFAEKELFITEETQEDDGVLFPELVHGEYVSLEGSVTRGNKNANTIGFEYKEHILTCMPKKGNITHFKDALFRECTIKGEVSRHADPMILEDKRPKIIFDELIPIAIEEKQTALL
jgi:hypothetical protein